LSVGQAVCVSEGVGGYGGNERVVGLFAIVGGGCHNCLLEKCLSVIRPAAQVKGRNGQAQGQDQSNVWEEGGAGAAISGGDNIDCGFVDE